MVKIGGVMLLLIIFSSTAMEIPGGKTQLTFSGVLHLSPCTLDTLSENQRINFNNVPVKNFYQYGRSGEENIVIKLNGCPKKEGLKVIVRFQGVEDKEQPGLLAVRGEAKGIAIRLETNEGKLLRIGQDTLIVPLSQGDNLIEVRSILQASQAEIRNKTILVGGFHSNATFILQYP